MGVLGNAVIPPAALRTVIVEDESGNSFTGVVVGEEVVFTAGLNDIRAGKIAANADGVVTGTKDIPGYRTQQGFYLVQPGEAFSINLPAYDQYNYTQLQCIMAPFNTSVDDSYAVDKIVLDGAVYMTGSTEKISDVTKNDETKSIDLNITNDSDNIYFIYFFTYKEEI